MVLYHVVTYYQLLWVFVYHMTQKRNSKGVIIMANSLETRLSKEILDKLHNYFEIRFFPYNLVKDHIDKDTNEELVSEVCVQVRNLYEKEFEYDLNQFDEINIAGYHFYFSLLLIEKNISFNVIEEAAGMLSRPEVLYSIVEQLNPYQLKIALESKLLYADNELIEKRFCRISSQVDNYENINLVDFDLMTHLVNNLEIRDTVINVFIGNLSKYTNENESILLLTQHFANLKILSFENQALIYQYMVDYFLLDKQLIIKPHPDDVMFYSRLFPQAQIIREKFPSELLPFVFEKIPDTVSTISSTAVFSIEDVFKNKVSFSTYTEKEFENINRYYVAIRLLSVLNNLKNLQCVYCDEDLVKNFLSILDMDVDVIYCNSFDEIDYTIPTLIGKCSGDYFSLEMIDSITKIEGIFLLDCNYNYEDCLNIIQAERVYIPIVIDKKRIKENYFFGNEEKEVFYFVSTIEENRKRVNDMRIEKRLEHTGLEICKSELSSDEIELMVTKGILKATEMRLRFVLEQNKELMLEIEKLKTKDIN